MKLATAKPCGQNHQVPETLISHSEYLDLVGMWRTIQGEGPDTGTPCIFVRFAGCNLQCPMCDTDYTTDRFFLTPLQLVEKIEQIRNRTDNLIVLTGGEPFRQNLEPLIYLLKKRSFSIQIETNGTIYPTPNFPFGKVNIICSPKTVLNSAVIPHISAFKYIIKSGDVAKNGLPIHTINCSSTVAHPPQDNEKDVYLQPLDEGEEISNLKNLDEAVNSCMEHGYRLSLQLHKYAGFH